MRYFEFLARYIIVPLVVLRLLIWRDRRNGTNPPVTMQSWPEDLVLAGHVATAVAYTTPWDNYLVASGVWWYEPHLVTGKVIGWVPIEEYTFFVLQTLLTGSWVQFLATRIPASSKPQGEESIRAFGTSLLAMIWLTSLVDLTGGAASRRYLNLIVAWAVPPIMLQTVFGGDILWQQRRLIAASIIPATLYLGTTDSLAIGSGTWAINPHHTTGNEIISNLPVEELLFFFLTNVLLVFGIVLVQSQASEKRLPGWLKEHYFRLKEALTGSS